MLREVAGNYIVVPVGKASNEFKGLINLNETGAFIWRCLEKDTTVSEIVENILKEYNIDEAKATTYVTNYINKLKEAKLLNE